MSENSFKGIEYPDWEVVRKIGSGSFGTVYEIERDVSGYREKAALKVISIPQEEGDIDALLGDGYDEKSIATRYDGYKENVLSEYSIMTQMRGCANIVYCDDIKTVKHDDGMGWDIYIKMELLEPLHRHIKGNITEAEVIRIGRDICNAISFCEKKKVVHRDIKPQNIFVSEDGTYKLGDFGIAKTVERTTSGTKTGTYQYMAPEVYNNEKYGAKVDIYSLGLVLYWLLNMKRLPFLPLPPTVPGAGDEEEARKKRFSGEKIPAPCNGSEQLKKVVLKACAYNPEERYRTAREFTQDLNDVSEGRKPSSFTSGVKETEETYTTGDNEYRYEPTVGGTAGAHNRSSGNRTQGTVGAFPGRQDWETKPPKAKKWPKILIGTSLVLALAIIGYFNIHIWKPATCTTPRTCSICGKVEGKELGHIWGEPTYEWSNDNSVVTARRICFRDKNHIETAIEQTTKAVTKSATCEEKGQTTYTAGFKNTAFTKQTKTIADVAATGQHKWNAATCTSPKTCSVCGKTDGTALGHKWVAATYSKPKTCSVCGKSEGSKLNLPTMKITEYHLNSSNKPYLMWNAVSDKRTYYVYQATTKYGSYTQVTSTAFTYVEISGCMEGKTYYFKVRAEMKDGAFTEYSDPVSISIPVRNSTSSSGSLQSSGLNSYYAVGEMTNVTFAKLVNKMKGNLDLKNHSIPSPDKDGSSYNSGKEYERHTVIRYKSSNEWESIGYIYNNQGRARYIIRSWVGFHKDGPHIRLDVYYDTDGTYLGYQSRDLTNNLSNSSTRSPYYMPGQGTHKLE